MEQSIVWILFIGATAFLGFSYLRKMKRLKAQQAQREAVEAEKREDYKTIDSEKFDRIEDDELLHAILYHIMEKEDQLYDGEDTETQLVDILTLGEKYVYSIANIEKAIVSERRGSIHTFFITQPYCQYKDYAYDALEAFHCHETAELVKAAAHLSKIIEEDIEEDDDDSQYGNYNFSDFTNEFASQTKSNNLIKKMTQYIRENKEYFIEQNIED